MVPAQTYTEVATRVAFEHRLEVFIASRDAGLAIARDACADGSTMTGLSACASALAAYVDEGLAIVREEYAPRLACREGCAHCCRKPGVLATVAEVARIVSEVRSTHPPEALDGLRARAAAYLAHNADPSVDCPLLVNDRCSVYAVRPMVCRGYNSTDAAACARAKSNPDELVPLFALLKDVTDGATVGAVQGAASHSPTAATVVDLGHALSIALDAHPDDVFGGARTDQSLPGPSPLAAAAHDAWAGDLWRRVQDVAHHLAMPSILEER